jgi:D-beta-D-heptose 7-phosphate kinase/D-beta-D-heptose 1-phosphate adenosyltransferase
MLQDFSGVRVVVLGDIMLDRYVEGSVDRLSPEAPVAVVLCREERDVLGGAANVAANLISLDSMVTLVGVIGEDSAGQRVQSLLQPMSGLDSSAIVIDPARATTSKTRVISGRHQMIRLDNEHRDPIAEPLEDAIIAQLERVIPTCDVVVVSDYAKGVCSDRVLRAAIETAATLGKPVLVDPKRRDFSAYKGATILKPNRQELALAVGFPCETDEVAERAANIVMELTGASILLTRSERGMSYFAPNAAPLHLPTSAQDVFDVSGAGDTVLAVVAVALASGAPIAEAMRLANLAAGIVLKKVGTAAATAAELDAALREQAHRENPEESHLLRLEDAVWQREQWRRMGLRVGFTNGCFDLLHPGHVRLLREAAMNCDRLIVAINTDNSVKRLKGPERPIQDERSRAAVLSALRSVDAVLMFDEDTPARLIEALKPDLLVKGADYREEDVVGAGVVKAAGGRVMLVPLMAGKSTTSMIKRSNAAPRADAVNTAAAGMAGA